MRMLAPRRGSLHASALSGRRRRPHGTPFWGPGSGAGGAATEAPGATFYLAATIHGPH
jgi:hypothetical protein